MPLVSEAMDNSRPPVVSVALCVDTDAFDRFGRVLRHLAVGLVDQAIPIRLLSCDSRVETLTLGPIQTLLHQPVVWPVRKRRLEQLVDVLSHQPPTVVHAMSGPSYGIALAIAEAFDLDVVFQVTSMEDCDGIAQLEETGIRRFLAFSEPLAGVLETQLKIDSDRIELVRPGVPVSQQIACFAQPQRIATILCTSPFEKDSGVDRLITALDLLRTRGHTPLVFLLGRGRYESALRGLARARNLSREVTFAQPLGDPVTVMRSADIFVQPSSDTGITADSLQAAGAGMAVVACSGGVTDHLRDGETALVCERATGENLADAIERLLADHAFARELATGAVEYVRTHHSMSAMAERTAATYRQLALSRSTFSIKE